MIKQTAILDIPPSQRTAVSVLDYHRLMMLQVESRENIGRVPNDPSLTPKELKFRRLSVWFCSKGSEFKGRYRIQ
jgi:hypothetical protein